MVLSDLAEFVNFVTRVKVVAATADNVAFGETERVRAREFAVKLSMRVLSRMWQMLLKGIAEVQTATRPAAAAEMVLVRIAYVADLPTPDEAIRMIEQNGGGAAPATSGSAASSSPRGAPSAAISAMSPAPVRAPQAAPRADFAARPQMASPAPNAAPALRITSFPQLDRARRREARHHDQGSAGGRCAAGAHRGRSARRSRSSRKRNARSSPICRASSNYGPVGAGP